MIQRIDVSLSGGIGIGFIAMIMWIELVLQSRVTRINDQQFVVEGIFSTHLCTAVPATAPPPPEVPRKEHMRCTKEIDMK